jgi:hypothetical protein
MPPATSHKSLSMRTQITLPNDLHRDLKDALLKRAISTPKSSRRPSITVSGWVREEARKLIQMHR